MYVAPLIQELRHQISAREEKAYQERTLLIVEMWNEMFATRKEMQEMRFGIRYILVWIWVQLISWYLMIWWGSRVQERRDFLEEGNAVRASIGNERKKPGP